MPIVKHQYDEKGNHRIVVIINTFPGKQIEHVGEWEWYQGFAKLQIGDKLYTASTEYYGESVQVSSIPIKVEHTIESVCRDCGKVFDWNKVTGDITIGCEHVKERANHTREMLDRMFKK